jgi:hypothetical protein
MSFHRSRKDDMGHIRLGTLPSSKKWRDVIVILDSGRDVLEVEEAAARASELDLSRASDDPRFQFVSSLLVQLPLSARAPGFAGELETLGLVETPSGLCRISWSA